MSGASASNNTVDRAIAIDDAVSSFGVDVGIARAISRGIGAEIRGDVCLCVDER